MDRRRAGSPAYGRQGSGGYSAPSSPAHPLAGGRRAERAKAASAFLAKRMVTPVYDEEEDDDDDEYGRGGGVTPAIGGGAAARYRNGSPRISGMVSNGFGGGGGGFGMERIGRNPSPKTAMDDASSTGSTSPPASYHSASETGASAVKRAQKVAAMKANARLAQVMKSRTAEDDEDDDGEFQFTVPRPSRSGGKGGAARFGKSTRSTSPALGQKYVDPTPKDRPSLSIRTTPPIMPPSVRAAPAIEVPATRRNVGRFPADISHLNSREPGVSRETSALRDEVDMLQDENEKLLNRLRLAEEKFEEAEARSRELEKQVSTLGEGLSLEVRLLKRKEAALLQKEKEMRDAMLTKADTKGEEVATLQQQVQSAMDEIATAVKQLREAESEAKDLRSMTQRMILTEEEKEEVELKRCWLARYWGLAVRYGIYPEIAALKHEFWSSLAPRPFEDVISAGQKAKEEGTVDPERENKFVRDLSDITGEGNIESMLSVEKGLRELVSLKVEDAIVLALAHDRRPNLLSQPDADLQSTGDPKFMEAFDLRQEEVEDVLFKQAWLIYFWRRAKDHLVEEDIAEERLQFWISRLDQQPTSHDAVDVEKGLIELRKLGIEQLLWEASRKDVKANQNENS